MKRRTWLGAASAILLSTLSAPANAQAADGGGTASTYQMNAAHDGFASAGVAAPGLRLKWRRDLGGAVSYPVIGGGRVWVTVKAATGSGTVLRTLDAVTGRDVRAPIRLPTSLYWWSALALGGGNVYALTGDGHLSAFHSRTGRRVWARTLPGQRMFSSAPTYRDGLVYTGGAGSGGTLYAVHAATGKLVWAKPVANGDNSSPAVTSTGVYVSYACQRSYRFHPRTGAQIWEHKTHCSGAGGRTPVVAAGSVWVRDSTGVKLNAVDGTARARFGPFDLTAPAFADGTGFFVSGGMLRARPAKDLDQVRWTFRPPQPLVSAPVVVGHVVYVGSAGGRVYALDRRTGRNLWSASLGAPVLEPNENDQSRPLTGLAAAQGILVVPASNLLVAYGK